MRAIRRLQNRMRDFEFQDWETAAPQSKIMILFLYNNIIVNDFINNQKKHI